MKTRNPLRLTALAAAIAISTSSLHAQAEPHAQHQQLFKGHVVSDAIVFEPVSEAGLSKPVDLIIGGPDNFYLRKSYAAGELTEFSPDALAPEALPDGTYRYEIRVTAGAGTARQRLDHTQAGLTDRGERFEGASGAFTILDGQIVDPTMPEPRPFSPIKRSAGTQAADGSDEAVRSQTFNTDLIAIGSACVGTDCVNNESFGFDTLRLKENNLRIAFTDTSSSASFPTNDWTIVANDSSNGGASYLAFQDDETGRLPFRVEAGAPSHSLYVDNGGRIGMGTANPVVEMHAVDGDTPTMRLEQDGSSGFASQTWDIAGNETSFFIRDASNGSTLPFRIRPGASSEALVIDSDSDIGIGLLSPSANIHVRGGDGSTNAKIEETSDTTSDRTMLELTNNGGARILFDDTSAFNNDWVFATTADRMRITKVGTPPELEVRSNGDLAISGSLITSTNTYPDYVFEQGYELMPITEVEHFITAHGHLPNMEPAEAIIQDGLNLTEGHIKLLEKIEELTLYAIQQEKRIQKLENALSAASDDQ